MALALEIDNLRAALGWAFAPAGDLTIGIGLTVASVPLWLSMSLPGEWHVWAEKAIHSLDEAGLRGTRQEMILQATLGISHQLVRGTGSAAHAALTRALELAEHLGDPDYQLRILHTFWIYYVRVGEVQTAMALARRADLIAASLADPAASATAGWMLGISLHWGGEHGAARRRLEHLLQDPPSVPRCCFVHRAGFDLYVVARYVLARILWLQGYPDQAMQALQASVEEARRLHNPVTLCSALALGGCALSIRAGDFDSAWRLATELVGYARKHALADFLAYGVAALEILSVRKEGSNASVEQLRVALLSWRASGWHIFLSIGELVELAANTKYVDEIAPIVDEELERAERHGELWAIPDVLRVKGELLLLQGAPDPDLAREYFLRSLECARAQGALSWELRTAISLALLERTQGRTEKARRLLQSVHGRFTEGFDTADLKRARRLLAELGGASVQQAGAARRPWPPDGG
jgi:tetratricopeptide (TPR) repeat protein